MNIRKNIDYSAMFAAMDTAMATGMYQMELCFLYTSAAADELLWVVSCVYR